MPMYYFRFEVRPSRVSADFGKSGGALVNCWVLRDTQSQAEAVAKTWIAEDDWIITGVEYAGRMTKEEQSPAGLQYFEQAEIDREVFVYYKWPIDAPDDPLPD